MKAMKNLQELKEVKSTKDLTKALNNAVLKALTGQLSQQQARTILADAGKIIDAADREVRAGRIPAKADPIAFVTFGRLSKKQK